MAEPLVAVAMGSPHALYFHIAAPFRGCRHRAGVGAEADQRGLIAEALATELADVELIADLAHVSIARVADVRVVRPHDRFGSGAARFEQVLESLEHVRVTQIPGRRAAVIHDAVVALGRGNYPCVLRGIEEPFAVLRRVFKPPLKQVSALLDDRLFAFAISGAEHRASVGRGLLLPRRETAVTLSRNGCSLRINLMEIMKDRGD